MVLPAGQCLEAEYSRPPSLLLLLVSQAGWKKSVIILAIEIQRNKGSFILRKMELLLSEEVGSPIAFALLILIFLFLG